MISKIPPILHLFFFLFERVPVKLKTRYVRISELNVKKSLPTQLCSHLKIPVSTRWHKAYFSRTINHEAIKVRLMSTTTTVWHLTKNYLDLLLELC